jgi:hypothetical protein
MVNAHNDRPPSPSRVRGLLAVATVAVVVAYGVAATMAAARIREVAWLGSLPSADAAAPQSTPARYSGKLHAPAGRTTPAGTPAAAYWWNVAHHDDDSDDLFCQGRQRSALSCETTTGALRIEWTEADPSIVGLVADDKDNEYERPLAIDIGNHQLSAKPVVPSSTCWGDGATYSEATISEGAQVEIVGCVADGEIRACDGPLHGVLAVPAIEVDRRHRFEQALHAFRFAFAAAFTALVAVGLVLLVHVRQATRAVRQGGRR